MNTPLSLLKSDTAMAVKAQKSMNAALAGELDLDRYYRADKLLNLAMAAPGFNLAEFNRLCRVYGVMV